MRGSGRTLGWKLKSPLLVTPSQAATSVAFASEAPRPTIRIVKFEPPRDSMRRILASTTSNCGPNSLPSRCKRSQMTRPTFKMTSRLRHFLVTISQAAALATTIFDAFKVATSSMVSLPWSMLTSTPRSFSGPATENIFCHRSNVCCATIALGAMYTIFESAGALSRCRTTANSAQVRRLLPTGAHTSTLWSVLYSSWNVCVCTGLNSSDREGSTE
mmetsp:Transcript_8053/g.30239  ORF Transcript_8053/g.30239 Transcript_8053/m.30239 type:complete len:216 (+) Transcript_8053:2948-3595(+)